MRNGFGCVDRYFDYTLKVESNIFQTLGYENKTDFKNRLKYCCFCVFG